MDATWVGKMALLMVSSWVETKDALSVELKAIDLVGKKEVLMAAL